MAKKNQTKNLLDFSGFQIAIAKNMKLPEMYQFEFDDPVRTFMQIKGIFFSPQYFMFYM